MKRLQGARERRGDGENSSFNYFDIQSLAVSRNLKFLMESFPAVNGPNSPRLRLFDY